ncbi:MAG: hypothetical protein MZV63_55835 [Marinilabiliales bacterium]|nr:hypothetical protein [Marinilabiliales bacterium]
MRCDGVNPGLLGMDKVVSEDALRNALKRMPETEGTAWLDGHLSRQRGAAARRRPGSWTPTPPSSRCTATRKAPCWATTRESPDAPRTPITPTSWRACARCWASRCIRATQHSAKHAQPGLLKLLDALPAASKARRWCAATTPSATRR